MVLCGGQGNPRGGGGGCPPAHPHPTTPAQGPPPSPCTHLHYASHCVPLSKEGLGPITVEWPERSEKCAQRGFMRVVFPTAEKAQAALDDVARPRVPGREEVQACESPLRGARLLCTNCPATTPEKDLFWHYEGLREVRWGWSEAEEAWGAAPRYRTLAFLQFADQALAEAALFKLPPKVFGVQLQAEPYYKGHVEGLPEKEPARGKGGWGRGGWSKGSWGVGGKGSWQGEGGAGDGSGGVAGEWDQW